MVPQKLPIGTTVAMFSRLKALVRKSSLGLTWMVMVVRTWARKSIEFDQIPIGSLKSWKVIRISNNKMIMMYFKRFRVPLLSLMLFLPSAGCKVSTSWSCNVLCGKLGWRQVVHISHPSPALVLFSGQPRRSGWYDGGFQYSLGVPKLFFSKANKNPWIL